MVAYFNLHAGCKWHHIFTFASGTCNKDFLGPSRSIFFDGSNFTLDFSDDCFTFWIAGFKDFLDTRETLRDIGIRGNTTRVEGTHGQLCTRLPDRLSSDGSDCFTDFNRITRCQVDTVTMTADTVAGVTCKDRANRHFVNTSINNLARLVFRDQFIWTNNDSTSFWMFNCFLSVTTIETLFKRLDHFLAFCDRSDEQAAICTTVVFTDNHILGNVNQTTSQVT